MKSFRIYTLTATLAIISVVTGYDYNDKEVGYLRSLDANWARHAGRDVELKQCVPIPKSMGLCRNVGYANMSLPNLLGHIRVEEVVRQAQPWVPLYNVRCHPNTDLFLCSLYAPVCLDRHIFPCRSLCEAVKNSCEIRMNNYGFKWPEILECERFPVDDDLCIKQINFSNDAGMCSLLSFYFNIVFGRANSLGLRVHPHIQRTMYQNVLEALVGSWCMQRMCICWLLMQSDKSSL